MTAMACSDWPRRNLGDTFMASSRSMKAAAAILAGVTLLATVGEASARRAYYPGRGGYHYGHYGYYHRGPGVVGGLVAGTALGIIGAAAAGAAAAPYYNGYYNGYPSYVYQPGFYGYHYGYDYHPGYGYYGPY
jgi:hypothetical protein